MHTHEELAKRPPCPAQRWMSPINDAEVEFLCRSVADEKHADEKLSRAFEVGVARSKSAACVMATSASPHVATAANLPLNVRSGAGP